MKSWGGGDRVGAFACIFLLGLHIDYWSYGVSILGLLVLYSVEIAN